MKVAVFTGFFLPHKGGVEIYAWEVYRRLRDVEATIVTINTEGSPEKETVGPLRVIRLPGWNLVGKSYPVPKPTLATFRLLRELWGESFDLVNTHTRFFLTAPLGLLFAKTKRIPLLHTEHGSDFVRHANRFVEWVALVYDLTVGKILFRAADRVIGVSQASARFAQSMGSKGRVEYVYNGVDIEVFQRRSTNLKKKLGIAKETLVVAYVGRLMKVKGPDLLMRAFRPLKTDAHLLIIGSGPLEEEIRKLSRTDARVSFLGPQERGTIPEFLSITDVFALPTTHPEGLPTSILEAGACGCAVVVTEAGGVGEVIRDGETGILLAQRNENAFTQALERLLESERERLKFGRNLRELVTRSFNWEYLAPLFGEKLRATYEQ